MLYFKGKDVLDSKGHVGNGDAPGLDGDSRKLKSPLGPAHLRTPLQSGLRHLCWATCSHLGTGFPRSRCQALQPSRNCVSAQISVNTCPSPAQLSAGLLHGMYEGHQDPTVQIWDVSPRTYSGTLPLVLPTSTSANNSAIFPAARILESPWIPLSLRPTCTQPAHPEAVAVEYNQDPTVT